MPTISMRETLAAASIAIERAKKSWREKPESAQDDLRFATAMLRRADDALRGELEISENKTK